MAEIGGSSSNMLKVVFLLHFILSVWGMQGTWSPTSYWFYNAFFFILLIWAMHHRESEDPVQMALVVNILSILFDIIVLSIFFPTYIQTVGSNRFSVGMAIINLVLRPVTSIGLYRTLQERAGFDAPAFPALGNLFGSTRQHSPYEDMDRPHSMPPSAAPAASSSSPTEKPYYNIVG